MLCEKSIWVKNDALLRQSTFVKNDKKYLKNHIGPVLPFLEPYWELFCNFLPNKLPKSTVTGHPRPWFLSLTVGNFISDDFKPLRGSPDSRPYRSTVDAFQALFLNLLSMTRNLMHCEVVKKLSGLYSYLGRLHSICLLKKHDLESPKAMGTLPGHKR